MIHHVLKENSSINFHKPVLVYVVFELMVGEDKLDNAGVRQVGDIVIYGGLYNALLGPRFSQIAGVQLCSPY